MFTRRLFSMFLVETRTKIPRFKPRKPAPVGVVNSASAATGKKGRIARDVMLGLAKTCAKLKISFSHYLGARLWNPGTKSSRPSQP